MMMQTFSEKLLAWYDQNARVLPWRVGPLVHNRPKNPYHIWLSEIMLQQTTVAAVKSYFQKFTLLWPTVFDLASASQEDVLAQWAGLGYYARARNLHKCAQRVVRDYGGQFPRTESQLLTLPGIGPYTAAAIAAIAFNQRAVVVDGNVERVIARIHAVEEALPTAKPRLKQHADALTPDTRCGDYAQAMMDLGATVCTPRKPACILCPVQTHCHALTLGSSETYPRKSPKKPKPVRYGLTYVIQRHQDAALLLERRPNKGLLGGMLGFPGTQWTEQPAALTYPFKAQWYQRPTPVTHVFTHFQLQLTILHTVLAEQYLPTAMQDMAFYAYKDVYSTLPTVMKKVARSIDAPKRIPIA